MTNHTSPKAVASPIVIHDETGTTVRTDALQQARAQAPARPAVKVGNALEF